MPDVLLDQPEKLESLYYLVYMYRTRAIISRSRFEAALVYKLQILGPTFLVYVLK